MLLLAILRAAKVGFTDNSSFLSPCERQNWTLAQSSVVHVLKRETPAETIKDCVMVRVCVSVNVWLAFKGFSSTLTGDRWGQRERERGE